MLYPIYNCCKPCGTGTVGRVRNMSKLCNICDFRTQSFRRPSVAIQERQEYIQYKPDIQLLEHGYVAYTSLGKDKSRVGPSTNLSHGMYTPITTHKVLQLSMDCATSLFTFYGDLHLDNEAISLCMHGRMSKHFVHQYSVLYHICGTLSYYIIYMYMYNH